MEKLFEKQSRLVQLILLLIPVIAVTSSFIAFTILVLTVVVKEDNAQC